MRVNLDLAILGCIGVSLAALAVEWRPVPLRSIAALPEARGAISAPPRSAGQHAEAPSYVLALLARPVFSQSRRPPPAASSAGQTPGASLPRLAGIVVVQSYRRAIFEGTGRKPVTVSEHDAIAGWYVEKISADSIKLQTGRTILSLSPSLLSAAVLLEPPKRDPWVTPAAHGILRARWSNSQYQP